MQHTADERAGNTLLRLAMLLEALSTEGCNENLVLSAYRSPSGKHPERFREALLRLGLSVSDAPITHMPLPVLAVYDYALQLDGILVPSGAHMIPAHRVRQSLELFFRSKRAAFDLLYRD
jgi:hypothetical protein